LGRLLVFGRFGTALSYSYMESRSLKFSYVGKENIRRKPLRTWIRNTALFLANLRSCDLLTGTPRKFAN
jgi:hypothetical protein